MPDITRRILVTSALPYASGPIHIGHLVEYVQTDIWVRFQRLMGHDCLYVCATDAHGTPTMLLARKEGISPEALVERFRIEHHRDLSRFLVDFDNFYTTHSDENQKLVEDIYNRLDSKGLIIKKTIQQAYDEQAGMFLPDRFVRGTCPHCSEPDQYGDSCEKCGRTYSPSELIDPRSVLSDTPPVQKESEHYFFRLGAFEKSLQEWTTAGHVDAGVALKLQEWFEAGLRDWDISRDAPYFGFRIPGTRDKFFYVWLDAPVGYMASLVNLAEQRGGDISLDDYFAADATSELYHFIGKDIAYFHTLFWPAVLEGAGFRKPSGVFVHGFLTVNGQKMSKSRGTFISGATYLDHLGPEHLRYYYAAKLGPGTEDIDLSFEDFIARTNSDLVGKFVNIASRCSGFITKQFDSRLAEQLEDEALYAEFVAAGPRIAELYESREYSRAMREIMKLADRANQYIDERKPWVLARDESTRSEVQNVCTQGLNLFRVLTIYLKPVLPAVAEAVETLFSEGPMNWQSRETPLLGSEIGRFVPLLTRVEENAVNAVIEASRVNAPEPRPKPETEETAMISIDDFLKVDLRIATVIEAINVDGADKLLRLTVDLGDEKRTVLSGIRTAYAADELVGRQVVVVANLEPRKMRFGVSQGMLLAAGAGDKEIFLIGPDAGATPGMRVR
jgi:methionyl-tRNA synthetase